LLKCCPLMWITRYVVNLLGHFTSKRPSQPIVNVNGLSAAPRCEVHGVYAGVLMKKKNCAGSENHSPIDQGKGATLAQPSHIPGLAILLTVRRPASPMVDCFSDNDAFVGWPEPCIYGVYTVSLAGKIHNIRSYTAYMYILVLANPTLCLHLVLLPHQIAHAPRQTAFDKIGAHFCSLLCPCPSSNQLVVSIALLR